MVKCKKKVLSLTQLTMVTENYRLINYTCIYKKIALHYIWKQNDRANNSMRIYN